MAMRFLAAAAVLGILGCGAETSALADKTEDAAPSSTANPFALPDGGGLGDRAAQTSLADPAPEGSTALNIETVADGLDVPWSISFFPGDVMLVAERGGAIRMIKDGALSPDTVPGGPEVMVWNQGGLFDIMPHPDYAENNVVFISYAHGTREENALRVARAVFDGAAISDLEVIYEAVPLKDTGHHFGGRLVWGGDDKIYVTIGEGARYMEKSQDPESSFGSVVRINADGSIPDDNPAAGGGALPELYSKGHRNAQGLAYDAERGVLWAHEHGARGGDELNIVEAGGNYAWPIATYGVNYDGSLITPYTDYEGSVQPVKYWTPSIAPSGLAVYRGDLFSDWDGDLLVGALRGVALHRVIMDGDQPSGEERYLVGTRIRDVRVGPDGAIYVAAESPEGSILKLTPQ